MGFQDLGPVLGGLTDSFKETRDRNSADAVRQQAREDSIFHALANSDDPEVRAAAVTGLLHNDHPGTFFDKFFQKHRDNPAFEHIKALVANGHQPTLGATEDKRRSAEANTAGGYSGRITGIHAGMEAARNAGSDLTPQDERRATLGALGAAERSTPQRLTQGAFYDASGKFVKNGWFDEANRNYFGDDGQVEDSGLEFRKSPAGTAGARSGAPPDPNKVIWVPGVIADTGQFGTRSSGGWKIGHKADGTQVHEPAQQNQSYSFIPTQQGVATGNTRTGALNVSPTGASLTAPSTPTAGLSAVRAVEQDILRNKPKTGPFGLPLEPEDEIKWRQEIADPMAKAHGFRDYADVQSQVGSAVGNVQSTVAPAAGGPGGPPPPAPGSGGPVRPRVKPTKATAPPAAPATGGGGQAPASDPLNILQHLR